MKESEIQCLKQEISSLKEELQIANRVIFLLFHFDLLNSIAALMMLIKGHCMHVFLLNKMPGILIRLCFSAL